MVFRTGIGILMIAFVTQGKCSYLAGNLFSNSCEKSYHCNMKKIGIVVIATVVAVVVVVVIVVVVGGVVLVVVVGVV